jgi:hypothetical protein
VDVVYLCRAGENEELRYSLRSLANLPHERVWIFGGAPQWVTDVDLVPTDQRGTKYQVTTRAMRAACECPDVSDPFILFNDDFYVTRPCAEVPVLHRGLITAVLADYRRRGYGGSSYCRGMMQTARLLRSLGYAAPLSYELHVPLPVGKRAMLEALDVGAAAGIAVLHKRTLYGNLARLGGERLMDVKITRARDGRIVSRRGAHAGLAWLSSGDATFRELEPFLRHRFPAPSPHEPPQSLRTYAVGEGGRVYLESVELPAEPVTPAAQSRRRIQTKGAPMFTVTTRVHDKAADGRCVLKYTPGTVISDDEARRVGLLTGGGKPKNRGKGKAVKESADDAPALAPFDRSTNLADLRAICEAENIDMDGLNTRSDFRHAIEAARTAKAGEEG